MNYQIDLDKLNEDVSKELVGTEVTGRFGTGTITEVHASHSNFGYGFVADVQFGTEKKQLQLNLALKSGTIKMSDTKRDILQGFTDMYKDIEEAIALDRKLKQEEAQKKREEEEAERKYREKIKASLEKVEASIHTEVTTTDEDLLWLKNNSCAIKAALPDYMESWFVHTFGDVKRRVVDSKKKTSGGFAYQWSLGLSMKVKHPEAAPVGLQKYISDQGTIRNTPFLSTLYFDHGFTIG